MTLASTIFMYLQDNLARGARRFVNAFDHRHELHAVLRGSLEGALALDGIDEVLRFAFEAGDPIGISLARAGAALGSDGEGLEAGVVDASAAQRAVHVDGHVVVLLRKNPARLEVKSATVGETDEREGTVVGLGLLREAIVDLSRD